MIPQLAVEQVAKVCHEVNRAYCESLGDLSQKSWEEAEQWQRDSAIKGVRFLLENPKAKPSELHESWLKEKKETGWKWGPVKDTERKEHPCFVDYVELPQEQRSKDYLFQAIVRTLLINE